MRHAKIGMLAGAVMLAAAGCYELVQVVTVYSAARTWTGTGSMSLGTTYVRSPVGLAGQDVVAFSETGVRTIWSSPALVFFGGAHRLTSITQTHGLGHHEHTFLHGNRIGRTDNLDLLYAFQSNLYALERVHAWYPRFHKLGTWFDIVEVCDMAAATLPELGQPDDLDSHLFLSGRACATNGTGCVGGVIEAAIEPDTNPMRWWVRSNQEGDQIAILKSDGTRFSNECMPISVTGYGDQLRQYLVVGDPSMDEISLFDAKRLWEGPLDSARFSDASRNIADVQVEERRDGSAECALVAVLWKGSTGAKIDHIAAVSGVFSASAHLVEYVPSNVLFIESPGVGAEGDRHDLYTFGSQVNRRRYQKD